MQETIEGLVQRQSKPEVMMAASSVPSITPLRKFPVRAREKGSRPRWRQAP